MKSPEPQPHLDAIREKVLPIVLKTAVFEGWNNAVLFAAAKQAGLHKGEIELALPRGCIDLIRYWAGHNDLMMLQAWQKQDQQNMRIRDKVSFLVRARLAAIGEENREASARAFSRLGLPDALSEGVALTWRTADAIWSALGDTSTDYNYYTKRAILSAVFSSTFAVWLEGDDEKTWEFLDRRIGNVMQFEGWKFKIRKSAANWPDPVKALSRLRYGRGRARPRRM